VKRTLSIALLVTGCGGAPKPPPAASTPAPTPAAAAPASTAERVNASVDAPKLRVAVGEFQVLDAAGALFKKMGWDGIGPMLTQQTLTALVQTGRVAVLERHQLRTGLANTQLEKESDLARYFDQKTTVASDKLQGAQAMLVGAITEFEPNISGANAGIDIASLGGLKYHQDKAVIGIELRLVDQETGRVLQAGKGRGEVKVTEAGGGASYAGVDFNTNAWWRTPIGTATRQAADAALKELIAALPLIPWEGKILQVKPPDKVFIDARIELNLKKGDRLRIVHRGDPIKRADGTIVGFDETEGGWVEVTSVLEEMSIAKVTEGELPKPGDIVRLSPTPR